MYLILKIQNQTLETFDKKIFEYMETTKEIFFERSFKFRLKVFLETDKPD